MSKVVRIFDNVKRKGGSSPGTDGRDSSLNEGSFRSFTELCQDVENNPGGSPGHGLPNGQKNVRSEAEEIVHKAREEAARIEQEAYDKGFAKGEQDGLAEAEKKHAEVIGKLEELVQTFEGQIPAVYRQHEEDLLVLIKAMVERLVNHEASVNPLVIQACLKKTMELVIDNSVVKVHLHTDDFNRLKEAGFSDPALFEGKNKVQLIEDPTVSLGGCLVSTDFGEIDATIENCRQKLFEMVDRAFLAALAEEKPDNAGPQE